jgi:hypothetical protein
MLLYLVHFRRRSQPGPFSSLAWGEAEGVKSLRCSIGAFNRSWSGGHCPGHVDFPADIDIEAPEADGSPGVHPVWGPSSALTIVPRFPDRGRQAFRAPDPFSFVVEGEVEVLETDRRSGSAIGVATCHPELAKFRIGTRKSLPRTSTVRVSNLAPTIKFIVHALGSRGCARWAQDLYWFGQNVPISSHQWLALPAPLMIKTYSSVTSG